MKAESKTQKIRKFLVQNGTITSWQAITRFRATRLADVVFRLKKEGFEISTTMKRSPDGTPFAEYRLDSAQRIALQESGAYSER